MAIKIQRFDLSRKENGSRFLVEESSCKISAPKPFPVAQNLGATLGLQASLQVALEVTK
jgi:hypothetical protein